MRSMTTMHRFSDAGASHTEKFTSALSAIMIAFCQIKSNVFNTAYKSWVILALLLGGLDMIQVIM